MRILENLQPAEVFRYFEDLCAIPHRSGNTKQISDYCVVFAEKHGLAFHQDVLGNVIIYREASVGCQQAEPLILQAHLDMVCEKESGTDIDFLHDSLRLKYEDDFIFAKGTTLGADDGIGVAMILALLAAEDLSHPRLEAVLTVDEEIGMPGASALDAHLLRGRRMLNLDSEYEGVLMSGCAGAVSINCTLPVEREMAYGISVTITVEGLLGGHSGLDMGKGRANANVLMGRLMNVLAERVPFRLVKLSGGEEYNVIPSKSEAVCIVPDNALPLLEKAILECGKIFAEEYDTIERGIVIRQNNGICQQAQALTEEASLKVLKVLLMLPEGVRKMDADIPGLVCASLNPGILRLEKEMLTYGFSVRSSSTSQKNLLAARVTCLTELLGGTAERLGDYPGWLFRRESPIRDLAARCFQEIYQIDPKVTAMHGGLECGIFARKIPHFDCVSIGPEICDIHTPQERLRISSVQRTWTVVKRIVQCCGQA